MRVEDVAAGGYTADRATVRQKKTGRPVRFELREQTRRAVDDYLRTANKRSGQFCLRAAGGPRGAQDEFVLAAIAQNLRRLASLVARPPPDRVLCVA
jgi:integrase